MASFAYWEKNRRQYVLGPPVWLAQEIYEPRTAQNPTFELSYWAFGLKVAQMWRERLGLPRNPEWDRVIMKRTLERVISSWGWDYPMIAMTAARLGMQELAVDILIKDLLHNRYMRNGHCPGTSDLPVYLPANGALLAAVALMAAGWDNAAETDAPGFPKNGKWKLRREGMKGLP